MDKEKSQKIKLIIALSVIFVLVVAVIIRVIIYQKVGEKKMPYSVSKIIVVSTANKYDKKEIIDEKQSTENENQETNNGEETSENQEESDEEVTEESQEAPLWSFDVAQTNDIYISIEKNEANIKKNEKIKSVTIRNISVNQNPAKGSIQAYMPNSVEGEKYSYNDDYLIRSSLTYRAAEEGNFRNLKIQENGGVIGISFANLSFDKFSSNDEEINYNGSLLGKLGLGNNDLKSSVSFDIVIELDDGKEYCGRFNIDIDCDNLIENGTSTKEITNFGDIVYKRI